MNANDIDLARRACAAFDGSVERIDPDTCRRLRDARLDAQRERTYRAPGRLAWKVCAALAAVMALMVFIPRPLHTPAANVPTASATTPSGGKNSADAKDYPQEAALDSMEAVDPDMLSDLDFYGWLATRPDPNASGG